MAAKNILPDLSELSIEELQSLADTVFQALEAKKDVRRQELLAELEKLGGLPEPSRRTRSAVPASDVAQHRASPAPKYRSKRDAEVTWSGRGALPRWMKEEMEEMNIASKEEFLIK